MPVASDPAAARLRRARTSTSSRSRWTSSIAMRWPVVSPTPRRSSPSSGSWPRAGEVAFEGGPLMLNRKCFVIMTFGEKKDPSGAVIDFDDIYDFMIRGAIEDELEMEC